MAARRDPHCTDMVTPSDHGPVSWRRSAAWNTPPETARPRQPARDSPPETARMGAIWVFGIMITCQKLGISFRNDLGGGSGVAGAPKVPPLADLIASRSSDTSWSGRHRTEPHSAAQPKPARLVTRLFGTITATASTCPLHCARLPRPPSCSTTPATDAQRRETITAAHTAGTIQPDHTRTPWWQHRHGTSVPTGGHRSYRHACHYA